MARKWTHLKRVMKVVGGTALAVAGSSAIAGHPWVALIALAVGHAFTLAVEMPRDPWTEDQRRQLRTRRQSREIRIP